MVTKLDRLSTYFLLFVLEVCLRLRMVSALCFTPATEYKRAGSDSLAVLIVVGINLMEKSDCMFNKLNLKQRLAHF